MRRRPAFLPIAGRVYHGSVGGEGVNKDEIRRELGRLHRSLFGCDGGNIRAKLWVCGIEWGGDLQALCHYPNQSYPGTTPTSLQIPYRTERGVPDAWRSSRYDLCLAGLCLRLFHDWQPEQDRSCRQTYLLHRLYNKNSDIFKLNLYSYPCPNVKTWDEDAKEFTRCEKKPHFRDRCKSERFPLVVALLKSYKPKVVLCTGTSYRPAFLTAFTGEACATLQARQGCLEIYQTGHTKVVIAPFRRLGSSLAEDVKRLL